MKPVEWRPQARDDAANAAHWHAQQGGVPLGEAFLLEVEASLLAIARHPRIGSLRHAECAVELPSPLRFLPLKRFKRYLIYYIDLRERVEVIRIWHTSRGLDALMDIEPG